MDVQTENMDPPSCESQPSGKIRKGFKLFGKRKPGNIFSIRGKGDGNNKSPVSKTKNLDGLSETTGPNSEQEPDKENGQQVSQGEMEHGEEESLGEDGDLAAADANASISSACSARSLSFLSLLKGGRKGGDRQVQTVSHPAGRKRRGLKGLFNNVLFRSKDKEDQEERPPSPLLMSSRANSVEIIKEDLTLTPKSTPRSLDSPETESCEPIRSLTTPDSAATTPSETASPRVTTGNVSTTDKHVSPLPTPKSPLVPGDNSLSSLLADISSLLTFDSITGGGDIMADVEAEWGKASSAVGRHRKTFNYPSNHTKSFTSKNLSPFNYISLHDKFLLCCCYNVFKRLSRNTTRPVTHSPPIPFTQSPPATSDCANTLNRQAFSSFGSASKAPVTVSETCNDATKPSSPAPIIPSTMTTVPSSTATSDMFSVSLPKSLFTSSRMEIPVPSPTDSSAPEQFPTFVSKDSPTSAQIPVPPAKAPLTPTSATAPCLAPLLPSPPEHWVRETTESAKMTGSRHASVDGQLVSPSSTISPGAQAVASKTDELHESPMSLQAPSREKRTPHVKTSGLSKIPVVGGGRAGKIPGRENQHANDEARRDPPTPVLEEERPHFDSHDGLSREKISDVRTSVPTSKCAQEESQQPPKVFTSLPRDSKIPVKHGAQSHAASQSPHEPPRTKIPVSKVPVRRVGKPAAAGGITQIKK
ncbi:APC membrane recruitment protein 2-like [Brachionichthys hirsutus]|uniref:APC membrane recruitment protein 2-like n=1 Tax=Brachionichthys hirsutus TaxID=412623 RepID=UPI0036052C11